MRLLKFAGALLMLLSVASTSKADIIAYEGFDYSDPEGTSINGLNGGFGWTEGFPAPSGDITLGSGLNFDGYVTAGGSMRYGKNANLTTDGRNWAATVADGTYWYSMLVNPQILDNAGTLEFGRGTFAVLQNSGDNQNGFGFRIDNNSGNPEFKAWSNTQASGANILINGGYDDTFFVLGRLTVDTAGLTTSDLWVFDSAAGIPQTEPGAPMSSIAQATGTLNAAISGRAFSNSGPILYDEIRIGTSFAGVLPTAIPEPSSLLVLGIATLFGCSQRRRPRR